MKQTCKAPGCNEATTNEGDIHRQQFCSTKCEVRHDHLVDDARDARMAAMDRGEFR